MTFTAKIATLLAGVALTAACTSTPAVPKSVTDETDAQWAQRIGKVVLPVRNWTEQELLTSGEKICADFSADPTFATRDAMVKDLAKSTKMDAAGATQWMSAAISHFCNEQKDAFEKARVAP